MQATSTNTSITLPDSRKLGYAEFGAAGGKPIIVFNGSASRLFYPMDDAVAKDLNARIISVERPGIGLSDMKPGRTLLDWADDIRALAQQLGLERFAVAGASAGGPYAAVCGFRLPNHVTRLGLISSLAPFDVPAATKGMKLAYRMIPLVAQHAPWLLRFSQSLAVGRPEMIWKQFYKRLPACDKAMLRDHPDLDLKSLLLQDMPEIYRNGANGIVEDMIVLTGSWGFDPAAINVQTKIWQGQDDVNVPPVMARYLANTIPNSQLQLYANEGHLMYVKHWHEIVAFLVEAD